MNVKSKRGVISEREYNWLKTFPNLTEEEEKKCKEFEDIKKPRVFKRPTPQTKKEPQEKIEITKALLWRGFKKFYALHNGKSFEETPETIKNIAPVILYFAKDLDFFKQERLLKNIGSTKLNLSFDKGLLIIGDYGNGKTSIMTTLSKLMQNYRIPGWFKSYSSHDLVREFEGLEMPNDRTEFYKRHSKHPMYIDDVKKEKMASNFGKVDVIRDILENRYENRAITHITCNYREGDGRQDLEGAMGEFGEKYGGHMFDRLFEMFNIIQFKGSSYRK